MPANFPPLSFTLESANFRDCKVFEYLYSISGHILRDFFVTAVCEKFHFWVIPKKLRIGNDLQAKIGNQDWEPGVAFEASKSESRFWLLIPKNQDLELFPSCFGSDFFKIRREWVWKFEKSIPFITPFLEWLFSKSGVGLKIWKINPDFSLPIPKI